MATLTNYAKWSSFSWLILNVMTEVPISMFRIAVVIYLSIRDRNMKNMKPDMKFDPTYTSICPPYLYSQIFLAFSCIQVTMESRPFKPLRETQLV